MVNKGLAGAAGSQNDLETNGDCCLYPQVTKVYRNKKAAPEPFLGRTSAGGFPGSYSVEPFPQVVEEVCKEAPHRGLRSGRVDRPPRVIL